MSWTTRATTIGVLFVASFAWAEDWPQWLGPKRDGVWRETGIIEKFPATGPRIVWQKPVGEGYSGPAVTQGKVFLTDRLVEKKDAEPATGFKKSKAESTERVLCFDERTGELLWKQQYQRRYNVSYGAGPRTTPVVDGEHVYTLGAMGDLLCLKVANGDVVWHKKLMEDYNITIPQWGFAGHPLIDGDRLICLAGGEGSVVVALDKKTGKEVWKNLSAPEPGYCPPMIYEIDGVRQLIVWHPVSVNSLDPVTGKIYWTHNYYGKGSKGLNAGLSIPTPRLNGHNLFLTAFYDGPLMLGVKGTEAPRVLWKGKRYGEKPEFTDGLHSIMSTPFIKNGYIYGVDSYGELRCLDEKTGERKWSTLKATTGELKRWGHAFLVEQGDRFILFNEKGDLIIAKLTPEGYDEISRVNILRPTNILAGRPVIWSHPAFANRCVFARNDESLICISMAKE